MVQRRSNGTYRVQYADTTTGKLLSKSFDKKEDALKFQEKNRRDRQLIKAGLELPKESTLVLDHAAKWIRARFASKDLARATVEMDQSRMKNYFLKQFGLRPMAAITSSEVLDHLDELQDEHDLSNATRNRVRAVLHTFFEDAFMRHIVVANPVARVPLLPEKRIKRQTLNQDECGAYIKATYQHSERLGLLATVLIYEGPRIGEAVALRHCDFDLKSDGISFVRIFEQASSTVVERTKGDKEGRTIPLFPVVKRAYQEFCKSVGKFHAQDYLFTGTGHECWSTQYARDRVIELCELAQVTEITPHGLRATFASLCEEAGYSKEDIQNMMGHSTVIVTERYVKRRATQLLDKGKKLGFGDTSQAENVVEIGSKKSPKIG